MRLTTKRWLPLAVATVAFLAGAALLLESEPGAVGAGSAPPHQAADADEAFAVVGDFGTGGSDARIVAGRVREWMDGAAAGLLVTTGDNVYDDGDPEEFDKAWRIPYGWVEESGRDIVASLGNHDVRTDGGRPVMELLGMPEPWYLVVRDKVELFVLDSNDPESVDQSEWLQEALADSEAVWKVVVLHHPPFSCGAYDGSSEIAERWVPLFESGEVDLVLAGHDHNYQRFAPMNGVTYIVSGGSGAGLYDLAPCAPPPELVAGEDSSHTFLGVILQDDRLFIEAIRQDGSVADAVVLQKQAAVSR